MSVDSEIKLLRPLSFQPSVEVWAARMGRRQVVVRRYLPLPPESPWPPPPDPQVLALVRHPRLARFLHQFRDDDGVDCHVFSLAGGKTLREVLKTGPLTRDSWFQVVLDCAGGLDWLHRRCSGAPRLHGDVSQGNILLTPANRAIWLDVRAEPVCLIPPPGLLLVGTLPYFATEVLEGEPSTPASEVFSLGLVAMSAATGPLPWRSASSPAKVLECHAGGAILRLASNAPAGISTVLAAMLDPSPANRPAAGEVASLIRGARPKGGRPRPQDAASFTRTAPGDIF